jgi:hypothetical protein
LLPQVPKTRSAFLVHNETLSIVAVGVGNPDRVPLGRQEVRLQEETGCAAAEAVISSKEKCQGNELRFHFLNVE